MFSVFVCHFSSLEVSLTILAMILLYSWKKVLYICSWVTQYLFILTVHIKKAWAVRTNGLWSWPFGWKILLHQIFIFSIKFWIKFRSFKLNILLFDLVLCLCQRAFEITNKYSVYSVSSLYFSGQFTQDILFSYCTVPWFF